MDKKLVQNYIYNVMYQVLVLVMPFITTPYVTRVMGAAPLSINTSTANIAQWFVLFGIMGVTTYGNREIARTRDDKKEMSKTFFEIFTMQFISMCLAAVAFFLYINFVDTRWHSIFVIQGITLLSVSLDITWFFYGVEDFKTASIRNMIVKILGVVLIFMFVKSPSDLALFVIINACSGVFGQLIMWVQLRHYVVLTPITLKGVLRHLKPNIALFIPQIAISVYSLLDVSMLTYLYQKDTNHVIFYEESQRFVKMFLFFITSIGSVMLPRVANTFQHGNIDQIHGYLNKTFKIALFMAIPMIFGIAGMIQNFIDWFLPAEFSLVGTLIICISPIILLISLSNVFGIQYMVPTGLTKQYTTSVVSGAVINFCINFTLIPSMGAFGAIIGSVCAELSVTFIQWFAIRKQLHLELDFRQITTYLFSSLVMFVVVRILGNAFGTAFWVNLVQIACGGLIYIGLNFILREPFQLELVQSLLKRRGGHHG